MIGTGEGSVGKLVSCRCRGWMCPSCGGRRGYAFRARLDDRFEGREMAHVGLVTLTCSPYVLGGSQADQWRTVRNERLVSEFVREFRRVVGVAGDYVAVAEFQKSGRIHYHLLIDGVGRLDKRSIGVIQKWAQRRMGTFDYKYVDMKKGIGYVTKYLVKGGTIPDWAIAESDFRMYSTSRGYWGEVVEGNGRGVRHGDRRENRPMVTRLAECGNRTAVIIGRRGSDREEDWQFEGVHDVPFWAVLEVVGADCIEGQWAPTSVEVDGSHVREVLKLARRVWREGGGESGVSSRAAQPPGATP